MFKNNVCHESPHPLHWVDIWGEGRKRMMIESMFWTPLFCVFWHMGRAIVTEERSVWVCAESKKMLWKQSLICSTIQCRLKNNNRALHILPDESPGIYSLVRTLSWQCWPCHCWVAPPFVHFCGPDETPALLIVIKSGLELCVEYQMCRNEFKSFPNVIRV